MADHEVTLGEVYRAIVEVRQEQRDMRKDLIGRAEYESDQEGTDRRFEESGKVHVALEAKVAAEGGAREVAVTKEATAREKDTAALGARIDRIGGWVKYGVTTALGLIVTVIGWILANGGGS